MPATDLLRMLRAQPFVPFRMHISGDTVDEIRHPEMVIVMAASTIVAFPDPANEELASSWELVDLRHIIRLEPIRAQAGTPRGEKIVATNHTNNTNKRQKQSQ